MRQRMIMILLAAGTVLGFGSGIRSMMWHHEHGWHHGGHGCHRGDWDRDHDRGRDRDRDRDRSDD